MTAIAQTLSRVSGIRIDIKDPTPIVIFCGIVLAVPLLLASYGLDLSAGFF